MNIFQLQSQLKIAFRPQVVASGVETMLSYCGVNDCHSWCDEWTFSIRFQFVNEKKALTYTKQQTHAIA